MEDSVARRRAEVRAPPPRRRSSECSYILSAFVHLGQVEKQYGSGAAMAKRVVGEAAMTAAAVAMKTGRMTETEK